MGRRLVLLFAALFSLGLTASVSADVGRARMTLQGSANAPLGYQVFCLSNPPHCRGGGASEVRHTDQLVTLLQSINSQVNRAISPRSDRKDVWSVGVSQGDCEEYALAKRLALIRHGVAASAVRIAMAKTGDGEWHAVVVVRTDVGDLVLDNLTSHIKNWDETGLHWIAIAGANGRNWQKIQ
ncbi:transglutaminase-like cysteine peptidase [Devosia faecipullorum]|uniref:transglutaminase-like cysteine peptidase n=1 Tax=Devosia faecipullorum TaxID=2755039 RepID=UPI00187B3045|nr:transglutaminase-like cysteine peptidase [Devosia faecipullorum]MBE7731947.1 transglutaminase-like cysteine peptidase [Devosia faecipullorum]